MSTASPTPPAPVTRMTAFHDFLVKVEQDAVAFPQLITAITSGTALPGPFSALEKERVSLVSAYKVFQDVKALLTLLATLPK